MHDIKKYDAEFTEATFLTKIDNIFIMICSAIMTEDVQRVDHFVGDELYKRIEQKVINLKNNNQRQMYDELNVKSSRIINTEVLEDRLIIDVELVSRYMDYVVDKDTFKVLTGNNTSRIQKVNHLRFEKQLMTENLGEVRKCPSCGANMDLNYSGVCEYCNQVFEQENHDWILTKLETF